MAYGKKKSKMTMKGGNFCIDNVPGKKAVLHKGKKKNTRPGVGKPQGK